MNQNVAITFNIFCYEYKKFCMDYYAYSDREIQWPIMTILNR